MHNRIRDLREDMDLRQSDKKTKLIDQAQKILEELKKY